VSKDFRYRDQIRDAIASPCRNTSEGFDRFRPKEFARFLEFARGSLGEVKDCLIDGRARGKRANPAKCTQKRATNTFVIEDEFCNRKQTS